MSKADDILTTAIMDMENRDGKKLDYLLIQNELGDLPKGERDKVEKELFDKINTLGYDYSGFQESKAQKTLSVIRESEGDAKYQFVNGTAYHKDTPKAVVDALEKARQNGSRVRIWYGDKKTGKSWHEEWDTIGTIGRSNGTIKIPILLKSARSSGGGGLLDDSIVRLAVGGKDVYRHPKYKDSEYKISADDSVKDYSHRVDIDGEEHARFKSQSRAQRYIDFMSGKRAGK